MTTTETGSNPPFGPLQVIDEVHRRFSVSTEYIREDGGVEFDLDRQQTDTKTSFLSLLDQLQATGYTAILRKVERGFHLTVFKKLQQKPQNPRVPLILFFATVVAVFIDGLVRPALYPSSGVPKPSLEEAVIFALIYSVSLMGILGIHEMGHKIASWHHKMDSSWPYFIPGIPGIWPTFGAVISARDPPPNRDALFDLGLSGPIAGLAVTVVVSILATFSAQLVPLSSIPASQLGQADAYTSFLLGLLRPASLNEVVTGNLFTLLYFAYSIGFLITFVNLLPAWQLDGGHIANSAVSQRVHKILTYVSILVMILVGFYLMAILILFFSRSTPSMQPLDNVSPISSKRKVFFVLTWLLAAAIGVFVIYNNAWFGFGLLFR